MKDLRDLFYIFTSVAATKLMSEIYLVPTIFCKYFRIFDPRGATLIIQWKDSLIMQPGPAPCGNRYLLDYGRLNPERPPERICSNAIESIPGMGSGFGIACHRPG